MLLPSLVMERRTVQLRVGGQCFRVVTTASEEELSRCSAMLDAKIDQVAGRTRSLSPQTIVLAALGLAHDLDVERARARGLEGALRTRVAEMLEAVEASLGEVVDPLPVRRSAPPSAFSVANSAPVDAPAPRDHTKG